jgi:DNA-directed RNA polymerase specialized sigma24 family protein
MSLGARVATNLPYLRRYARALTGSQATGDAFVRETLEAALADEDLRRMIGTGRAELYHVFNKVWGSAFVDVPAPVSSDGGHEAAAQERLSHITPLNRQALLLTTLEDFSIEEAAFVMDKEPSEVEALVQQAIAEIDRESAIEDLVRSLGHEVCGMAATRSQAQQIVAETTPGLVLADIQLADGSSGLDAVDDILQIGSIPVIFITAYPERLLTGDRPEPTYLVTKPFQESTVRAAISQALFFGSSRPLA